MADDGHTPASGELTEEQAAAAEASAAAAEAASETAGDGGGEQKRRSRLTPILLGLLLLALGAFIWVNYVWLPGQDAAFSAELPEPEPVAPLTASEAASGTTEAGAADGEAAGLDMTGLPAIDGNGEGEEAAAGEQDGTETAFVAPDLTVTDLPLLVTVPPPGAAEDEEDESPTRTRAQLLAEGPNPFSPVRLAIEPGSFTPEATAEGAGAAPAQPARAPAEPEVVEVDVPEAPDSLAGSPGVTAGTSGESAPAAEAPQLPAAPDPVPVAAAETGRLPSAAADDSTAASEGSRTPQDPLDILPRPLPGPALSAVPSVLREHRSPQSAEPRDPAAAAALAEPASEPSEVVTQRRTDSDVPLPDALPPVAERVAPAGGDPLVAGATPLSRYLRDNDVRFTGLVLGPISHGVFHVSSQPRPVVLALGAALPETDITLTDLRGQQ